MKSLKKIGLGLLFVFLMLGIAFYPKYKMLNHTMHLFDEDKIVSNFYTLDSIWPVHTMTGSENAFLYPKKPNITLPESFSFKNEQYKINEFIKDSWTTGFIVIQNDTIVYEEYFLDRTESTRSISWSTAKSVISALIGIALEDGLIADINQDVDVYVPELIGTGYEGVKIKDVLQMSTGVQFNEDYGDFYSDINRWGRGFALGRSQDAFAASLERETEPGKKNHYVSINTHVLGMILTRVTGKTIAEYMQEKLYNPLGMEFDGYWLVDGKDMEMALGGMNLALRDFAKIGSLYLHNGSWNGNQIVPKEWVQESVNALDSHVQPGEHFGYGYQWWIPKSNENEFMAIGVYNQYIYVNPSTNTVIVKLSANPHYNNAEFIPSSDYASLELFREIAKVFKEEVESVKKNVID
jgi:CubicO group peptidase (beta-lactamase class C family)